MELPPYETLMAAFRAKRRALGVQQKWLAQRAGISPAYLSRMERAATEANYSTVHRVWTALDRRERGERTTAADIMTPDVAWVSADDACRDARELMFANAYSQLPVREDGRSVGSVTERTLVAHRDLERRIGEVMEDAFLEVRPGTSREACAALLQEDNPALLVHDGDGYVGIVTPIDLV